MNRSIVTSVMLMSAAAVAAPPAKVQITATDEARALYLKGRDLAEKLRGTDAHVLYEQAVAKDPSCAMCYLGLANTAGSPKGFREALDKAVALAGKVSAGEALLIRAADAGARGDLAKQREALEQAAKQFPSDERVLAQLAGYHFGNQDYNAAITVFEKTIKIAPDYSQTYNQLGYAYRFVGKPAEAEKAFKKYIQLIPDDPNPYDSYAELLMEEGKFAESIDSYQKALKHDPNFIASYIGIGNDQVLLGKGDEARATYAKMAKVARNDGERRQAITWTALSYTHEAAWDKALAEIDKQRAIATSANDLAAASGDELFAAAVLIEAGRGDAAAAKYKAAIATIDRASVPEPVKEQTRRNALAGTIRIALIKPDVATAKTKLVEYTAAVAKAKNPFEQRQAHELAGLVAIAEKQFKTAVTELAQANPRDPRVLYWQAVAAQGTGDTKKAKALAQKAADFNGLAPNYGYVRAKAKTLAKS